jgi:hypothetical protein
MLENELYQEINYVVNREDQQGYGLATLALEVLLHMFKTSTKKD